jgi:tRNA A37 threonylcarbamoyladenosine modification protein TsaB
MAAGAELVGVISLDALAHGLDEGLIVSMISAGKGEAFVQMRRSGTLILPPSHIRMGDVVSRVQEIANHGESVTIVGEVAVELDWTVVREPVSLTVCAPHDLPSAAAVGRLAAKSSPVDADALEPVYVRAPDITMPKTGFFS